MELAPGTCGVVHFGHEGECERGVGGMREAEVALVDSMDDMSTMVGAGEESGSIACVISSTGCTRTAEGKISW